MSKVGRMALVALALPAYVRSKVDALLYAERELGVMNDAFARADGQSEELRRLLAAAGQTNTLLVSEIHDCRSNAAKKDVETVALWDEVKILRRETADLRDDAQRLTSHCSDWKRVADEKGAACEARRLEIEHARETVRGFGVPVSGIALARAIVDLGTERDEARAELAALKSKVEPAPVDTPCSFCLEPSDHGHHAISGHGDSPPRHPLCAHCSELRGLSVDEVVDRVKLRSECCHSRRTSPYPLAVPCTLGCGALAGQPCDPTRHVVSP